jgi:hypothetical protein
MLETRVRETWSIAALCVVVVAGCSSPALGDPCASTACPPGRFCFDFIECNADKPSLYCCNGTVGEFVGCTECGDASEGMGCTIGTSTITVCGETYFIVKQ